MSAIRISHYGQKSFGKNGPTIIVSSGGKVDKYSWQEVRFLLLPGELTATFLWTQLEDVLAITAER